MTTQEAEDYLNIGLKNTWGAFRWKKNAKLKGQILTFYSSKCRVAILIMPSPTNTEDNKKMILNWEKSGYHLLIFSTIQIEKDIFKVLTKINSFRKLPELVEQYYESLDGEWKNKYGLPIKR